MQHFFIFAMIFVSFSAARVWRRAICALEHWLVKRLVRKAAMRIVLYKPLSLARTDRLLHIVKEI